MTTGNSSLFLFGGEGETRLLYRTGMKHRPNAYQARVLHWRQCAGTVFWAVLCFLTTRLPAFPQTTLRILSAWSFVGPSRTFGIKQATGNQFGCFRLRDHPWGFGEIFPVVYKIYNWLCVPLGQPSSLCPDGWHCGLRLRQVT